MILLKSCPRCQGDMLQEEVLGDVEMVCLQCGFRADGEPRSQRPAAAAERAIRKAA